MHSCITQKAAQMGMTNLTFYSFLETFMPNSRNRQNLRGLMDLLADGHADSLEMASRANNRFILADEKGAEDNPTKAALQLRFAVYALDGLCTTLESQRDRIDRVIAEVVEIKKNARVS